ncbi:hypothetical protein B0T25DRAFT_481374, partial [Lasiosphaeria hispida]
MSHTGSFERLGRLSKLPLDDHAGKLHQLYPDEDAPDCVNLDIILVHGLEGHFIGTWKADHENDKKTVWPCHLLPEYLINHLQPQFRIRVFSYSYDGTYKNSTSRIRNHTNALLRSIQDCRDVHANTPPPPVIFVGHSLGGVIVKQTLRFASDRRAPIAGATCGVVFFSTPHKEIEHDDWKKFVANLVTLYSEDGHAPTTNMLNEIQNRCEILSDVTEDFQSLLDDVSENRRAHVQLESGHDAVPNSKSMAKYLAPNFEVRTMLSSLCTDMFHEYYQRFSLTEMTCSWIKSQQQFQDWQQGSLRKLCISGDLACGKTHLAAYIVAQVMGNRAKNVTYLQCFLSQALPERRDCCSIFRSTIHQVSKTRPDLIKNSNLQAEYEKRHKPDQTHDIWDIKSLRTVWKRIISEAAKSGRLSIIIDGFDQISQKDQREFLHCFEECEKKAGKAHRHNLQLLIMARPDARLDEVDGFSPYDITEQNVAVDIRATVSAGLRRLPSFRAYSTQFQHQVFEKITQASGGVYLWASLVVSDLKHRLHALKQEDLEKELDILPREIAELYDSILGRMKTRSSDVKRILRWVLFRQEALRVEEVNAAVALSKLRDKGERLTEKSLKSKMVKPAASKISLYAQCGQLIRFTRGGEVEPIHDSLTEYLSKPPKTLSKEKPGWNIPNHRFFYLPEEESHGILGNLCVQYLTMSCFGNSGAKLELSNGMGEQARWEVMVRWESKVRERVKEHKFVRYAALCWSRHLQKGGSSLSHRVVTPSSQLDDIRGQKMLEDTESSYAICWSEVWWLFRRWPRLFFP